MVVTSEALFIASVNVRNNYNAAEANALMLKQH